MVEVPLVINGKPIFTGKTVDQVIPSDHSVSIARVHQASPKDIQDAIEVANNARHEWANMPLKHRMAIFYRAADLISAKHRARMNAVTMLGTSKNIRQAEIDCIAEHADFLRMNCNYAERIQSMQPDLHSAGSWNRMSYRELEGFVACIAPFNFCAIGTNLNTSPAIMGNTTLWKPSQTAVLENYFSLQILEESGLPPGVINFLPSAPEVFSTAFSSPHLAGLHFTGSTPTFRTIWKQIGNVCRSDYDFWGLVIDCF